MAAISRSPHRSPLTIPFADVCALVAEVVAQRPAILSHAGAGRNLAHALRRLREGMRQHVWHIGGRPIDLGRAVAEYDARTRAEGLHALNDWDGVADAVNVETIAVDVLDFVVRHAGEAPVQPVTLAVLLDYYLMYLLALLSLRVWDDGAPDDHLARLDALARRGAGAGRQRPAVLRRRRGAAARGHRPLRTAGERLRPAAAAGADAGAAPADPGGAAARRGDGLPPALRVRSDLRPRHHPDARRQRRRLSVAVLRGGRGDGGVRAPDRGRRRRSRAAARHRGAAERPDPRRPGVRRARRSPPSASTRPSAGASATSSWPIAGACATSSSPSGRPRRPTRRCRSSSTSRTTCSRARWWTRCCVTRCGRCR